jgi:hypothetical protein
MATNAAIPSSTVGLACVSPQTSPYTGPRLIVEGVRVVYDTNHLASLGLSEAEYICMGRGAYCHCLVRVAENLPVPSGWLGPAVPEIWNVLRGKVGIVMAVARTGIRWFARKVGGLLGKWLGVAIGTIFAAPGVIIGAAVGIAIGCLVARLACATL